MRFLVTGALWMVVVSGASSQVIKDGGVDMVVTPGSHGVSNPITSSNSYIFQAENSVTIKPSGTTAFIVTEAGGTLGQYFIARIKNPTVYAELVEELDAGFHSTLSNTLFFKYVEKYATENSGGGTKALRFTIYDNNRTAINAGVLNKSYGINYFQIDLTSKCVEGNFYVLEVIDDNNEVKKLRFKYSTLTY